MKRLGQIALLLLCAGTTFFATLGFQAMFAPRDGGAVIVVACNIEPRALFSRTDGAMEIIVVPDDPAARALLTKRALKLSPEKRTAILAPCPVQTRPQVY